MNWERLVEERGQHIQQAYQILEGAWSQGRLPTRDEVPHEVAVTVLIAMLLANLAVVLLLPKGRKTIWIVTETVLASILLVTLAFVVLGLPFGKSSLHDIKHAEMEPCPAREPVSCL